MWTRSSTTTWPDQRSDAGRGANRRRQLPCYLSNGVGIARRGRPASMLAAGSDFTRSPIFFLHKDDAERTKGHGAASAIRGGRFRRGPTMSPTRVKLTTPGCAAGTAGSPKWRAVCRLCKSPAERHRAVHFACRSPGLPSICTRGYNGATLPRNAVVAGSKFGLAADAKILPRPTLRHTRSRHLEFHAPRSKQIRCPSAVCL